MKHPCESINNRLNGVMCLPPIGSCEITHRGLDVTPGDRSGDIPHARLLSVAMQGPGERRTSDLRASVERRKVAPFECVVTISGDARALLGQADVPAATGLATAQSALAQHAHRTRRRAVRDVIDVS